MCSYMAHSALSCAPTMQGLRKRRKVERTVQATLWLFRTCAGRISSQMSCKDDAAPRQQVQEPTESHSEASKSLCPTVSSPVLQMQGTATSDRGLPDRPMRLILAGEDAAGKKPPREPSAPLGHLDCEWADGALKGSTPFNASLSRGFHRDLMLRPLPKTQRHFTSA